MVSTIMDYKTHVFNAALEGNLMGLKVRLRLKRAARTIKWESQ